MTDKPQGPVMLAMTSALRPPPARISRIGENVTLPVSLQINHVIAAVIGAATGLVLTAIVWGVLFNVTLFTLGLGLLGGGFVGVIFVTWSPLKGESMTKWLGLTFGSFRGNRVEIAGEPARAYIGIAKLECSAAGSVRVFPGAVNVPLGSVDERGVLIPLTELRHRDILANQPARLRLPGIEDGFDPVRPELTEESLSITEHRNKRWGSAVDPVADKRR